MWRIVGRSCTCVLSIDNDSTLTECTLLGTVSVWSRNGDGLGLPACRYCLPLAGVAWRGPSDFPHPSRLCTPSRTPCRPAHGARHERAGAQRRAFSSRVLLSDAACGACRPTQHVSSHVHRMVMTIHLMNDRRRDHVGDGPPLFDSEFADHAKN